MAILRLRQVLRHGRPLFAVMDPDAALLEVPGTLWDPLVIEPILPIPSRWIAEPGRDTILDMLGAFFGPPYRDWWLSYSRDPDFTSPYENHWLVTKSAARAFSRGVIKLDRLQPSMVEFEVVQASIGPEDPVRLDGSYPLLGDHSRAGTLTVDPRFVGTHVRFSKSLQLIQLSDKFSLHENPDISKTKHRLITTSPRFWPGINSLMQSLWDTLLATWLFTPTRVRILAYRMLRQAAQLFIEPDCHKVRRLPFGLYLKSAEDLDCLRNEVNALRMVRRYLRPDPQDVRLRHGSLTR